jgi:hypothetical protein
MRYQQAAVANTSVKRDPAPKIERGASKIYEDADEAVADIQSGAMILSAGFGLCGTAGERYYPFPLVFTKFSNEICVCRNYHRSN